MTAPDLSDAPALRARIARNLAVRPDRPSPGDGRRRAAVALVLLPAAAGGPAFLLTRRASRLSRHAGQYALPGGRVDPGETAVEAVLRELDEELGIAAGADAVLGRLDDLPTASGYLIAPFVLWLDTADPRPDPAEVAAVHHVPLVDLFAVPAAAPRRIAPEPDAFWMHLPALGHEVYAPTAAILHQFREVALMGRDSPMLAFREPGFARR